MARDAPVEEHPGKWKKGDVVVAASARHTWGRLESLPRFVQIDVTDASRADIENLLDEGSGDPPTRRANKIKNSEVDDTASREGGRKDLTKTELDAATETRDIIIISV
jgi:hypothetical protein